MGEPHFVHDTIGPGVQGPLRVGEKLEHQAVANQICRLQSDRLLQLQKLVGALVGRFEFPPKRKSEQALVKAARPRGIGNAQANVVENDSVTDHYSLQHGYQLSKRLNLQRLRNKLSA